MAKTRLFSNIQTGTYENDNVATYKGITIKTAFSLVVAIIAAFIVAFKFRAIFNSSLTEEEMASKLSQLIVLLVVCSIIGFISVLVGRLNVKAAKFCAPLYAVCEGAFVGTLSMMGEMYYPGIVLIASVATVSCFLVMLALFASGIIRNYNRFQVFGISFGATLIVGCLVTMILSIFIPTIANNIALMIGIEALFIIYACITLMMNFIECTTLVKSGCDKSYEWSVALGLLVTILYIYVEIFRLLIIILDRSN